LTAEEAEFIAHDCSKVMFVKEVDYTYAMWMHNHAQNEAQFIDMCKMMHINTKAGGKTFILCMTADQDFDSLKADSIIGKSLCGLEKLSDDLLKVTVNLDLENEDGFKVVDWCFHRDHIKRMISSVGFSNVQILPSIPLDSQRWGDPVKMAAWCDNCVYTIFVADKLATEAQE
jgi:hypothetical protein